MKPDLSNMDQVINNVVSAWKQQATEQGVRDFNNFLKAMYVKDVNNRKDTLPTRFRLVG
jgi:hypothetical protein